MEFEGHYRHAQSPKYDCLLFDLDDTLYPFSSGISSNCTMNIEDYMLEKLGIEKRKLSEISNFLYKHYGTTMAGLRAIGYKFDYDEYHGFVHGKLPYDKLKPDPVLRHLLLSLPIRKVIFTNGDKIHAARVLSRMGLEDCFEGIICFETLNPPENSLSTDETEIFDILEYLSQPAANMELPKSPILCKPSEDAMVQALKIANIDPQRTIFFDDSIRNIQAAQRIGLHTVLVGTSNRVDGADHALESIHNIKEALPELWEEAEKAEEIRYSDKVAIESADTGEILKGLIVCASVAERNLAADASSIMEKITNTKSNEESRKILTDGLQSLGYNAAICKSRWEKSPSYPGAGEHEYFDVIIGGERILIDLDFRSEFEIARSTKSYRALLQSLPSMFVGTADRVSEIVTVVSEAAKQSLKKKGLDFPPWRKPEYMRAKWLAPHERETRGTISIPENKEDEEKSGASDGGEEEVTWQLPAVRPKSSQNGTKVVTGLASVLREKA